MTERIGRRWTRGVIVGWGALALVAGAVLWVSAFFLSFLGEGTGGNQRIDEDWSVSDALGFATFFGLGVFLLIIALVIWHRMVRRRRLRYDKVSQELISGRQRVKARQIDVLSYGSDGVLTIYFTQPDGSDKPLRPWKVDEITDEQWPTVLTLYRVANEEPPGRTRAEAANEVPARRYAAEQADLLWSSSYESDSQEWNHAIRHALLRWIRDPENIDLEKGLEWIRAEDTWADDGDNEDGDDEGSSGETPAPGAPGASPGIRVRRTTTVTSSTVEYRKDENGRWVPREADREKQD